MCFESRVERKGERLSGARLNGAGGSMRLVEEDFEVEVEVLKARAFAFPFGGILLSSRCTSQGSVEVEFCEVAIRVVANNKFRPP